MIPENIPFLVTSTVFKGPCRAKNINFKISGTLLAPYSPSAWSGQDSGQWLAFNGVTGLHVDGFGALNGQGEAWWDQSCRSHPDLEGCTNLAPTALKFTSCNNSSLKNMYFINSPQTHVTITRSTGFKIDNLRIKSPESSPNTDGIHIQSSKHLSIANARISSGDDCISIGDYTSHIHIANIQCGPGHGISIGSLGRKGNVVRVENIHVSDCTFTGTTNGARIKTWQRGRGYVRRVIFENLRFQAVKNPIIIDQNYCEKAGACPELDSGVHISNVVYRKMTGTSSTDIAIKLECSRAVPCSDITMSSIHFSSATPGKHVTANCSNARGQEFGVIPGHCLKNGAPALSNHSLHNL